VGVESEEAKVAQDRDLIVQATAVQKTYDTGTVRVDALRGVDLALERGEMVAIMGPSGCGKTTLLNCLSGLDAIDAGQILIEGTALTDMSDRARTDYRARRMGFVFQFYNLMPVLTSVENVELPLLIARVKAADRARRAGELLELLGVGDRAGHRPEEMSGGEQQRVALAVALANSPQVLLADEPTGELDEATSHEVFDAIRAVNTELGVTVLVVTHDPLVSEQVDRTVAIRDGRTSTEVLRRTELDEHGRERVVAREFAVLDRAGRMQLPQEFVGALGLRDLVRLELEADHVGVWPGGSEQDDPEEDDVA
jgi:putative ABC transport system ATP-binding protein